MKALLLSAYFVCLGLLAASPARAADIVAHDLPAVSGQVVKVVRYVDTTGDNLILLTVTEQNVKPGREHPLAGQDQELFAHRLLLKKDGSTEQVWRVTDYIYDCDLGGLDVAFNLAAFRLTDLNNNGVAEIWLTYVLGCRSEPGALTMKIIMYEGGQKYAVRGETRSHVTQTQLAGGSYKLDEAFAAGPAEFTAFAKQLWEKYKNKY